MWPFYFDATTPGSLLEFLVRFTPLIGDGGFIHAVHLFCVLTKLNRLTAFFFAARAGFLMGPPIGVFL